MNSRSHEYVALLQELQNRYRDVPPGTRWAHLMTVGLAVADANSIRDRGKPISEAEFLELSLKLFRRMRSESVLKTQDGSRP
jgi:hypothetical protein